MKPPVFLEDNMSTKSNAIETACASFHRALVGDAKLPSQHATNREGIELLETLMGLAIAQAHARVSRLRTESPEDYEHEERKARREAHAMRCAMGFLKAQHNAVPVVSVEEEQALEEASAAL